MAPKSSTRTTSQSSSRVRQSAGTCRTTCKTCSTCRQKKIKCSGTRPRCDECTAADLECAYPRDARREPRPSRARFQNLEATVSAMLEHIQASGISAPGLEDALRSSSLAMDLDQGHGDREDETRASTPGSTASVPMPTPTPTASIATNHDTQRRSIESPLAAGHISNATMSSQQPHHYDPQLDQLGQPGQSGQLGVQPTYKQPDDDTSPNSFRLNAGDRSQPGTTPAITEADNQNAEESTDNGLSPCEARVAGVFHEHGCVSSVHGLAGIMNPTRRALHKANISKVSRRGEAAVAGSRARLISNAALQKQREPSIFRQPQQSIDLDGCEPELARHLIDLHFNRYHCSYLLTYRPAILDSIANGGPYVNKLLLNAIYYSSTLYSDREAVGSPTYNKNNTNPDSVDSRFYKRFRYLLADEMDKPSVPSAVALLLTSATLVSQGKVSAGWALSGTAYRMIIDLGCHLMLGPDYQEVSFQSSSQMLQADMDHEMRKRLYWGAYITDVTQSLYLGRQCSFATTEARVPLRLLDTFEELEAWYPYVDPTGAGPRPPPYSPQPAHAVSTFSYLVRLMQIGAQVTDLYGIQTVGYTTESIMEKKAAIELQLDNWINMLPDHLVFDPDGQNVPPPHQITPHTTFHALRILLYRAFLEEGHLRRHSDASAKRVSEEQCIASALMIERHIRAYRNAFTLRRAPFLLSYAIYSAVAIILPQERHDRGHFTNIIAFFWTCLGELQHGCNFGLKKPLSILRDMVQEFQLSVKERGPVRAQQPDLSSLDESFFPRLPLAPPPPPIDSDVYSAAQYLQGMNSQYMVDPLDTGTDMATPGLLDFLNDQEWDISQNTLYGLFAPGPSFQGGGMPYDR